LPESVTTPRQTCSAWVVFFTRCARSSQFSQHRDVLTGMLIRVAFSPPIFSEQDDQKHAQNRIPEDFSEDIKSVADSLLSRQVRQLSPLNTISKFHCSFLHYSPLKGLRPPISSPAAALVSGFSKPSQDPISIGESIFLPNPLRIRPHFSLVRSVIARR
jgi:hypothetical protein